MALIVRHAWDGAPHSSQFDAIAIHLIKSSEQAKSGV